MGNLCVKVTSKKGISSSNPSFWKLNLKSAYNYLRFHLLELFIALRTTETSLFGIKLRLLGNHLCSCTTSVLDIENLVGSEASEITSFSN